MSLSERERERVVRRAFEAGAFRDLYEAWHEAEIDSEEEGAAELRVLERVEDLLGERFDDPEVAGRLVMLAIARGIVVELLEANESRLWVESARRFLAGRSAR